VTGISRSWLALVIVLAFVPFGSAAVASPVAAAEEAVLIPGATVFKQINPIYPIIAGSYRFIGVNFHTDEDPQLVDYSQDPLDSDRALVEGVDQSELAVRAIDHDVVVIGESMGSMVASRLAAELAGSSDPPAREDIRFVLMASPEEGVAKYFKVGTFIPVLNYKISRVAESPYATTVVIGEYDGWADPPDRPWNLVALANSVLGILYVHGPAIWDADPAAVPSENTTVDGNVTTHLVPTENLPLAQPFRDFGIHDTVMDNVDRFLRPIVDAGYVRHDQPGDTRPYLSEGTIVRNGQAAQQTIRAMSVAGADDRGRAATEPRRGRRIDTQSSPSAAEEARADSSAPRGGLRAR
jgi:pimeloyl-ACP methyl ester carboxylesterase